MSERDQLRDEREARDAVLEATGIHKRYLLRKHVVSVLEGASLRVAPAEILAIVGASGAGKSTLLHIIGGLDAPDSGCVHVEGHDLYGMRSARRALVRARQIGFVFQSYHLLPEMDVLENVMLPGMADGRVRLSWAGLRSRAMELLEHVGLGDRAEHTPYELSGGEQQRAALARALMNDPRIVLADEPTGNLDEETGRQVLDYLFSLTRGRGHSLVIVTHSEAVAAMCDRTLRLESGTLVDVAPTSA